MRIPLFMSIYAAVLFAILLSPGCSKPQLPPGAQVQKLGEIELLPQTPKRVPLGEGRELVITATAFPSDEIQLNLQVEPRPRDGSAEPWGPAGLLMRYVRSGKEYDVQLGGGFLQFTPRLKKH
ncbi:MAG TPA: hypothetical protein VN578_21430 [Candidatus Binatia bacterium]|nr:hypothetical protein [Candidatus Binatia bacterium]